MNKKALFIEKELFEIPYKGGSIIYAPLKNVVFLANKNLVNLMCDLQDAIPVDLESNKKVIGRLKRLGIVQHKPIPKKNIDPVAKDYDQPFLPTNLTLFLTSDCNLACRYCYGGGGEKKISMPLEIAYEAVDMLFLHAARGRSREVHLGFHGGGEPMLRLNDMKKIVDSARSLSRNRNIGLQIGLTTNGAMSSAAAEWIADNVDQLNVSFDGLEEVQNYQRPMKNGSESFARVTKSMQFWDSKKKKYNVRGTITRFSQDRIPELVSYITDNFDPVSIHLEPMFCSARADNNELNPPDTASFVSGFLEAERIAQKKGIELYFSGKKFPNVTNNFCGIGWKNLAVTPEGNVTSCFEVLTEEDHRARIFFYGRYVPSKGFHLDMKKISSLRKLSEQQFSFCQGCFAKFHCAGDCRAKGLYRDGVDKFQGTGRCGIIREITKAKLFEHLSIPKEGEACHG